MKTLLMIFTFIIGLAAFNVSNSSATSTEKEAVCHFSDDAACNCGCTDCAEGTATCETCSNCLNKAALSSEAGCCEKEAAAKKCDASCEKECSAGDKSCADASCCG